jgi:sulfur-oxidizing protein SoxA
MRRIALAAVAASGLTMMLAGTALTDETNWGAYQVGEKRSGYTYAAPETRSIQDDDFENPAMLWVDTGQELWDAVDGEAGKACASCHDDAADSMADVGATFPVYYEPRGKLINIEQRINLCRTENMGAKAWKWESRELLSMTAFVRHQSRGKPVAVKIDGPAAPFYEKGKDFYYQRRGQSNGFPTYRLKWQKVGSLHRRFRGCNKQVRATPYKAGSEEYVNLELYLADRGRGLLIEAPAVRN